MKRKYIGLKLLVFNVVLAFLVIGCSKSEGGGGDIGKDDEAELPAVEFVNGNTVYGYILDGEKKPLANVVVTDGYSVVKTDSKGVYQFKKNDKAKFVYYTTPAEYEIAVESANRKMALFYKTLDVSNSPQQKNFTLHQRTKVDKNFGLFGLGDPQVANNADVDRFTNETLEDVKAELATISQPVYGISLGDVVADNAGLLNTMKTRLG